MYISLISFSAPYSGLEFGFSAKLTEENDAKTMEKFNKTFQNEMEDKGEQVVLNFK